MSDITLLEAINLALHHEMARDPDVVVLGEDVGVNGGVFRATVGLRDKFGFKRVIDTLIRSGNAYFIRKNGQAILMAENIKENASVLTRFKRAERSRTGAKSIKRGTEIPIAVLVPNITMKRRFDLEGTVRGQLPVLARAIEKQLNKI